VEPAAARNGLRKDTAHFPDFEAAAPHCIIRASAGLYSGRTAGRNTAVSGTENIFMSHLDPLLLARIQFGFTISFHIVFPAITIGLGSYLAVLEGLWLLQKDPVYLDLYHFWSKAFAVNFAMGVVSGLVMAYEFGTNWSYFSTFAGGVTGPLLAYEVLTAFFLEAGFLGVMLFGWNKVGPGLHFFATVMVAAGTLVSMTWILASNSWMQTPQGYEIIDGRVVPTDWLAVIFNPSFPYRLVHMGLAAFLAAALFVGAAGAWHLLKHRDNPRVRTMFSMAMWMVLATAPVQIFAGDQHGLNTLQYQPAKIAAMEGHWINPPGEAMPLILFGWPDMAREKTLGKIEIPYLGSLILTHTRDGRIKGLGEFPPGDRPNAAVVFWTFRLMVGLGMLMLLLGLGGAWFRWRGQLYERRLFLCFAVAMGPAGIIALLAGWMTTEIGRQPWVVYGVMRTADAVSRHSALAVSAGLLVFVLGYCAVFGTGICYLLKLVARGPDRGTGTPGTGSHPSPARPLSAAPDIDPAATGPAPVGAGE
jgi:cytochrome d ubiquinol oxidase subunit I